MGRTKDPDIVVMDPVLTTISPELFATVGARAILGIGETSFWVQDANTRNENMKKEIRIKGKIRN